MKRIFIIATVFAALAMDQALAYTGPGLGAATIAVVVGFFTSIFVALFAVIWYPVKRLLKNRKSAQGGEAAVKASDDAVAVNTADPQDGAADKTAE